MKTRIKNLQSILTKNNLDALLVNELSQIRYLCGYSGTNALLVVFARDAYFLTDFRYKTQIATEVKGVKKILAQRDLYSQLSDIKKLHRKNLRLGYLENFLPARNLRLLRAAFPNALMAPTNDLVESLSVVKDSGEIKNIERAVAIADTAFERILQIIRPGVRESEIAAELEYQLKMLGGEKTAFDTIVASGVRSAMPHGIATHKKIKKGEFVTLDFGTFYRGYASDITRTIIVGKATAKQKNIYALVKRAQIAGTRKAKAGLTGTAVDKHVRDIIDRAGFGKNFGHGLGHGLGLVVHDNPRLSPLSPDTLAPNMVVTIEPGVYIEGWGGVRIEDDVVITKNSCRILNRAEKSLIEL